MGPMALDQLGIKKHADKTAGVRAARFDPETGERFLYDPSTPGYDPEPWPLAGVSFVAPGDGSALDGPPKEFLISTTKVQEGLTEGWISGDVEPVHRPAGPPEMPWRSTHTFLHATQLTFHTLDGDFTYDVKENPDKWPAEKQGELGFGGEVKWAYHLKLAKGGAE